ncbi:MAG: GNAT family N-acetyltransferase, partial [Patescibacteria group bacterium]
MLTPDDFRTKSGRDAIEGLRQSRRIGVGGRMMIGSVDYFFGRGRETLEELEYAEAFPVGPSLGVMIQEDPETQRLHLTHTFQMFQHGDPRLKRHSVTQGGAEIFRVNQEDANLQEYDSRTFHRKFPKESGEAFKARVESVENFEYLLRISDRIRTQGGPDLLKLDYDPLTLISAVTRAITANQGGFVRFVRDFGLNGLRSVVGFDGEEKATRALYKLGDELPQALAHRVMARIGRVANAVASVMKQASELLPEGQTIQSDEAGQIRAQLLRRGGDVLAQLTQELAVSDASEASVEARIAEEMKKIEAPLLVLASTYKVLHDEGQRVKLEDLKEVEVDVESGAEISKKDRLAMREIADENWSQYPRLHAAVVEGFDAALQNPANRFYIARYRGEMLGFVRFDDLKNGNVYAGSLNIRPELRGSSLGETILKMAIVQESRNHPVEATAYPKLPIAERYIGDFGFVVSGMIPNFEKTGE